MLLHVITDIAQGGQLKATGFFYVLSLKGILFCSSMLPLRPTHGTKKSLCC
jgi:hypothetical protein